MEKTTSLLTSSIVRPRPPRVGSAATTTTGASSAAANLSASGEASVIAEGAGGSQDVVTPQPPPATDGGGVLAMFGLNPWRMQRERDEILVEEAELLALGKVAIERIIADHLKRQRRL